MGGNSVVLCIFLLLFISLYADEIFVPMCNDQNLKRKVESLTATDLSRIKSLEQLHILSRHGTRTGDHSVLSIFPNMNTSLPNSEWHCNFTTVTARDYNQTDWIALQKNFVPNEQIIGGNCEDSQSLYKAVNQHMLNARMIRKYYIGDEKQQLMSEKELQQIASDMFIEHKYENNNSPFIKTISTDLERCFTSVSVFMTHFLELDGETPMDRYLYTYTHDEASDPYTPQKNANCPNLKKWMVKMGKETEEFQNWINGEDVQTFYTEFEKEVGYNLNDVSDVYKICSNIVWMYCGGIDVVPGIISDGLFNKVHNFSLEYRKRLYHSGPLSQKTTSLATMPFAWVMRTLITDFIKHLEGFDDEINGYLEAERAKLVFHSTRGISTLLILEPLGLSNGLQPIYANMVNLEIYSKNDDNEGVESKSEYGYDKYLFRFTNMGEFVPFPGCSEDYMDGTSTLCNLQVLIDRFNEYAMYLNDWEPMCRDVTDSYFEKTSAETADVAGSVVAEPGSNDFEKVWFMIVGMIIGIVMMWLIDRKEFVKNIFRYHKYSSIR